MSAHFELYLQNEYSHLFPSTPDFEYHNDIVPSLLLVLEVAMRIQEYELSAL
jgi:hypothetical protein